MNNFSYGIKRDVLTCYFYNINNAALHIACRKMCNSEIFISATFDEQSAEVQFKANDIDAAVNEAVEFTKGYLQGIKALARLDALAKDLNNGE